MKFLHLGDLHIGKSLADFDLCEDQKYILSQILEIADERKVDGVLLAGDIYDRSVPGENAVGLLDWFIGELAGRNLKTFIISGNHDSDERLNFGSRLFARNQIYISAKYNGILDRYTFQDAYGTVHLYLMPFIKASQVKKYYPEEEIHSYDDAVRIVLENSDLNPSERNILVAHQFVTASDSEPRLAGSEGASVKNVGTIEKISASLFDAFDYVALGHIHSPQSIGRDRIRYAGSPLKYSLSEVNHIKSVPVISLQEKNQVEIELVELKPKRDLRHIKGTMEQLLDKSNIVDTDDFIYVTLTQEEIVDDAISIFQQIYPNTIKIDYENSHTNEIKQIDFTEMKETRSFPELISDFYNQIYGCEISEEELALVKSVAKEVDDLYEAD